MSYIITYVDDQTKNYLRAQADDGVHGVHNVMFPKQMSGIPSRFDKKNVGTQIEVSKLNWIQKGKNGYYNVAAGDIIGVVNGNQQQQQPQQQTSPYARINTTGFPVGQIFELDPAWAARMVTANSAYRVANWAIIDDSHDFIIGLVGYAANTFSFVANGVIEGRPIDLDGSIDYVLIDSRDHKNQYHRAKVAVKKGILENYAASVGHAGCDPICILSVSPKPGTSVYHTVAEIEQYNQQSRNEESEYTMISSANLPTGQIVKVDPVNGNEHFLAAGVEYVVVCRNGQSMGFFPMLTTFADGTDITALVYTDTMGKILKDTCMVKCDCYHFGPNHSFHRLPIFAENTNIKAVDGILQAGDGPLDDTVIIVKEYDTTTNVPKKTLKELGKDELKPKAEAETKPKEPEEVYKKFNMSRFKRKEKTTESLKLDESLFGE